MIMMMMIMMMVIIIIIIKLFTVGVYIVMKLIHTN